MVPACSRPTACSPSTTRTTCPRKSPTRSRNKGIGRLTAARARVPPRKGGRSDASAAVIAELGHYALVLALGLALVQAIVPIYGARQNDPVLMSLAAPVALAQFAFVAFAFAALVICYVTSDFSVINVFENSHSAKPLIYKITGVWGKDRKSTRLNSSHLGISYAVFCLKKKKQQ